MEGNRATISFNHHLANHSSNTRATLYLNGPINEEIIVQLLDYLTAIFDYYQYDMVELRINSPGGQMQATHYLIENLELFKKKGKIISTTALFTTASAAALILSCGSIGYRSAYPDTVLLYHDTRIYLNDQVPVTSGYANRISKMLESKNKAVIKAITNVILKKIEYLGQNYPKNIRKKIMKNFKKTAINELTLIHEDCFSDENNLKDYLPTIIENLLDKDQPLTVKQAFNLFLIDKIGFSNHGI